MAYRGIPDEVASPVIPSDIEPLLGSESDTFCDRMKAMVKLSWLVFKYVRWKYNALGTDFSDDYKAMVCAARAQCPED
jgi:hypothetical protein